MNTYISFQCSAVMSVQLMARLSQPDYEVCNRRPTIYILISLFQN